MSNKTTSWFCQIIISINDYYHQYSIPTRIAYRSITPCNNRIIFRKLGAVMKPRSVERTGIRPPDITTHFVSLFFYLLHRLWIWLEFVFWAFSAVLSRINYWFKFELYSHIINELIVSENLSEKTLATRTAMGRNITGPHSIFHPCSPVKASNVSKSFIDMLSN